MNFVATPQLPAHALAVVVHSLIALRAKILRQVFVIFSRINAHADLAELTVEEVFFSPCLAYPTFVTVKYSFARVIFEQVAGAAEVFAESYLALATRLLWRLHC